MVDALAVSGSTVYVGGYFTTFAGGGTTRKYIAAIDASTGTATAWNPDADDVVDALAVSGSTVYAGGYFTNIGGQARNSIAALDASTGAATSWNPNANGEVDALAVSGSTVYAGGNFTTIGGEARNYIAALDASTGSATTWHPDANYDVYALAFSGSTVYAGGDFTAIGGEARNRIAAIDANSPGTATGWDPNPNGSVCALALSGSTVYAGGYFTTIGGVTRNCIAALDVSTGVATSWDPDANNIVYALAVSGSTVYAGGTFTTIGGEARNRIAALDASTGSATTWDPDANNIVYALAVSGSTVYAGGEFTTFAGGGTTRNKIAAIDSNSPGLATSWNPNANNYIRVLAVSGSTVYAGGQFTTLANGGTTRNNIAAIDADGNATDWDPDASGNVNALAVSGSTVYAGGQFTSIGGQTRNNIAAIDSTSPGNATTWDPNGSGQVYVITLDLTNARVYVGGNYTTILNSPQRGFAGLTNPDDGALPVELTALNAMVRSTSPSEWRIELNWRTATEKDNYGFEVERRAVVSDQSSVISAQWLKVGFVNGSGTCNSPKEYSFADSRLHAGRYAYRLKQVDVNGMFKYSQSVEVEVGGVPKVFSLSQNYPNPFNPSTTIEFTLAEDGLTTLKVFDILGREVSTLVKDELRAGVMHQATYSASNLSSGLYFYRLESGKQTQVRKFLLMK